MAGPKEQALRAALAGTRPQVVLRASTAWTQCAETLIDVHGDLKGAAKELDAQMGQRTRRAAQTAFTNAAEHVSERRRAMRIGSLALERAHRALKAAQQTLTELDSDPGPVPPKSPDYTGLDAAEKAEADKIYGTKKSSYDTALASREQRAARALRELEAGLEEAADQMEKLVPEDRRNKEDEPKGRPPGTPPGTPPGHVPTGYPPPPPPTVEPPVCLPPPVVEPPVTQPPVIPPVEPPVEPPVTVVVPPEFHEVPTDGNGGGGGTQGATPGGAGPSAGALPSASGGPAGAAPGISPGGVGGAAGGAVAGGAAAFGAGARPAGMAAGAAGAPGRAIGATSRAAGRGTLSRSAVAGAGAGAGRGAAGGRSTAAGRAGAAGGAGGSRGSGSGSRTGGRTGGRGAAAGAAGGAGGRSRSTGKRGATEGVLEDEQDWLDDEEAAPGVID